jgi:geranylgeranyl diphosphate synthase type II
VFLLIEAKVSRLNQAFENYLVENRGMVDIALDHHLPGVHTEPHVLHEAMRYSVFAGGKRIRPILAIASAEVLGENKSNIMPFAAALECIHTYSLIHDDLPSMDNDDMRRGKPTSHKVFGESTAILAGDALLTLAFEIMSSAELVRIFPCYRIMAVIRDLGAACGSSGLIAGQVMDMACEGKMVNEDVIRKIVLNKTAALIKVSLTGGAKLAGATLEELTILSAFGEKLGMAFQIRDDLLDLEGDPEKLGKAVKKDSNRGKATYPSLYGADLSRGLVKSLLDEAGELIGTLGAKSLILRQFTEYMGRRVS